MTVIQQIIRMIPLVNNRKKIKMRFQKILIYAWFFCIKSFYLTELETKYNCSNSIVGKEKEKYIEAVLFYTSLMIEKKIDGNVNC
jgi:hypothetical protein